MRIAALELPGLPWQVVRRDRPALADRPVAIVAREGPREVVVAASPAALALGVVEGASVARSRTAAPGLSFLPREPAREAEVLSHVAEALLALAPFVELAPPDALLLDPSGARFVPEPLAVETASDGPSGPPSTSAAADVDPGWLRRRAQEGAWARAVLAALAELGLSGRLALADTAAAARLLAPEAEPVRLVAPRCQMGAVGPVPLARLARLGREAASSGVRPGSDGGEAGGLLPVLSPASVELLEALGVRRLADVLALPPRALVDRLGTDAEALLVIARGGRARPLVAFWPRAPLVERLELEAAVESAERLVFALRPLVERLEVRLSGRGESVTRLGLVVELEAAGLEGAAPANGVGIPRRQRLERVLELARPAASAKVLLEALRDRLSAWALPAPVVACALEVREATRRGQQLELGERPAAVEALEGVLARLSARLGEESVGSPRPVPCWIPERAVARRPFQPGPVPVRGFERVTRADRDRMQETAREGGCGLARGTSVALASVHEVGDGRDVDEQTAHIDRARSGVVHRTGDFAGSDEAHPGGEDEPRQRIGRNGDLPGASAARAPAERVEAGATKTRLPAEVRRPGTLRLIGDRSLGVDERGPAEPPDGASGEENGSDERPRVLARPTRLFAPEGLVPEFDASGAVCAAAWRGRVHRVLRYTRPERLATGWWSDAEVRDYATWLLANGTRLWVFRDSEGRWWAQGIHD